MWAISSSPEASRSGIVIISDPDLFLGWEGMGFACLCKVWDLRGRMWALLAEVTAYPVRQHICENTHTKVGNQGIGCEELGLEMEAELVGLDFKRFIGDI